MREEIVEAIGKACKELFDADIGVQLTRPEQEFGDYSTNVAMQLAGKLGKNPREIAEQIADNLKGLSFQVEVAGPGFINLTLSDGGIFKAAQDAVDVPKLLENKVVVAEYSDPNPFKILHVGHIYTTVVGDAIANIMETAGATVHRVNYGGDVGLHVGKTIWALLKRLGGEQPKGLAEVSKNERAAWMASAYVEGHNAYETDEIAKPEIVALNKRVYQLHAEDDHDSPLAKIYWTCRTWSYEAFDAFYARLGTGLERYYPESEVAPRGLELVKQQIGTVFVESDGAVVFKGEDYGLHTRVFINREGLPTYEAKEIGLFAQKKDDYTFDRSVIVTANEQEQYMAVVVKALEQFMPEIARVADHVSHGIVKLPGGVKMSSRLGNIVEAHDVLDMTSQAIADTGRKPNDETMLGAIKYAFLKVKIGGDLIYDVDEAVSLEGYSGPYLQYALVRARSILSKIQSPKFEVPDDEKLDSFERSLARKLSMYSEAFEASLNDYSPHHIANYLYELAQTFNRFYENSRVTGDPREALRGELVKSYERVLAHGLGILGMPKPEKM